MLGRVLFRWRGAIGTVAYAAALALGRPTPASLLTGLAPAVLGLGLRFWAMGHIGAEARAGEVGARRVVRGGPYRLVPHPLYLGNFLLVCGTLVGLRPPLWYAVAAVAGFIAEYALIARAEERFLAAARPEPDDSGFSLTRAAVEWRTWVTVLLAFGLGLAKALFRAR